MGFAFPLFTTQMFDALGYRWGNTLFALVAVVLMPIPFVSPSANARRISTDGPCHRYYYSGALRFAGAASSRGWCWSNKLLGSRRSKLSAPSRRYRSTKVEHRHHVHCFRYVSTPGYDFRRPVSCQHEREVRKLNKDRAFARYRNSFPRLPGSYRHREFTGPPVMGAQVDVESAPNGVNGVNGAAKPKIKSKNQLRRLKAKQKKTETQSAPVRSLRF